MPLGPITLPTSGLITYATTCKPGYRPEYRDGKMYCVDVNATPPVLPGAQGCSFGYSQETTPQGHKFCAPTSGSSQTWLWIGGGLLVVLLLTGRRR